MKIEINNTTKNKINTKILKKAADVFGKKMGIANKEVSLAFVSANKIRQLNKSYRGIDKVTDVLAFGDNDDEKILGEVVLCYPQIKRQAKELGVKIEDELAFVFIHGLLHLLGYNDRTKSEQEEMMKVGRRLTETILQK